MRRAGRGGRASGALPQPAGSCCGTAPPGPNGLRRSSPTGAAPASAAGAPRDGGRDAGLPRRRSGQGAAESRRRGGRHGPPEAGRDEERGAERREATWRLRLVVRGCGSACESLMAADASYHTARRQERLSLAATRAADRRLHPGRAMLRVREAPVCSSRLGSPSPASPPPGRSRSAACPARCPGPSAGGQDGRSGAPPRRPPRRPRP